MYEPASLGMFQCRLQRILCDFEVIMFFRKDPPQTEGRRHADPLIKTGPGCRGERPLRAPRGLKVWFSRGLNIHQPTCWSAFGARADISRPAGYMLISVRKKKSLDNL